MKRRSVPAVVERPEVVVSHPVHRSALCKAIQALRPQFTCSDVAVGLRISLKRSGGPTALVHVGDGIYRLLVGLVVSEVYRGEDAATRCAADLVDALEVAASTQASLLRRPADEGSASE